MKKVLESIKGDKIINIKNDMVFTVSEVLTDGMLVTDKQGTSKILKNSNLKRWFKVHELAEINVDNVEVTVLTQDNLVPVIPPVVEIINNIPVEDHDIAMEQMNIQQADELSIESQPPVFNDFLLSQGTTVTWTELETIANNLNLTIKVNSNHTVLKVRNKSVMEVRINKHGIVTGVVVRQTLFTPEQLAQLDYKIIGAGTYALDCRIKTLNEQLLMDILNVAIASL